MRTPYVIPIDISVNENAVDIQTFRFPNQKTVLEQVSFMNLYTVVGGIPAGGVFATDQFSYQIQIDEDTPYTAYPLPVGLFNLKLPFVYPRPIEIENGSALTIYTYNLVQNKTLVAEILFQGYRE